MAQAIADAHGGVVRRVFQHDSEPALVPGTPVFENLTLGFEVRDARGDLIARLVDDLTLQADLDREADPTPGWFRVVSDDRRLLHLVRRHGRADAGPVEALAPVAALFGTRIERDAPVWRVVDPDGAPVAMAAPVPGERERAVELVTPPLPRAEVARRLASLLAPARRVGLSVPAESATHLHVDRRPFEDAGFVRRLVHAWRDQGEAWQSQVGTNPRCRRLGAWPEALVAAVDAPDFESLPWPEARARLAALRLSKFVDLNLKGLVHDIPGKPTLEARFFPGCDDAEQVAAWSEAWLDWLDALR